MAVDDLSTLFTTLPGVFDLAVFQPHTGGDWLILQRHATGVTLTLKP